MDQVTSALQHWDDPCLAESDALGPKSSSQYYISNLSQVPPTIRVTHEFEHTSGFENDVDALLSNRTITQDPSNWTPHRDSAILPTNPHFTYQFNHISGVEELRDASSPSCSDRTLSASHTTIVPPPIRFALGSGDASQVISVSPHATWQEWTGRCVKRPARTVLVQRSH